MLILQPQMGASAALVMTALGAELMTSTPPGPVQEPLRLWRLLPDQAEDQAPHFWHRQWQELGDHSAPFSSSGSRRDRTTAT